MTTGNWELLPHFLLRSTGFPFHWLEQLAFDATAAALDALCDCEEQLAALGAESQAVLRADDDQATLKLRRRCWDRINRNRPLELDAEALAALPPALGALLGRWDSALARRAELERAARATFERELPLRREALRMLAEDPRFQEAVWLSSPQMLDTGVRPYLARWDAQKRPSEVRRIERQLVSYLQRFCAKNDTTSFFGPINYGDFLDSDQAALPGPGAGHVQRREAFLTYWGTAALTEALAADDDIRPYLRPRRSPLCQVDPAGRRALVAGELKLALSARALQVLELADGRRTIAEIASAATLPFDHALEEVLALSRARLLILGPEVPVTQLRPLDWLCQWAEQLPAGCAGRARWVERLTDLKALQDRFAGAPLAEKQTILAELEAAVQQLTGQAVRRGGGQFYADRLLLYEEAMGGVSPLALGPGCGAVLQAQLAPVLDLYAAHAGTLHAALQQYGATLLRELSPEGSVPFLQLIKHLRQHELTFEPPTSAWQQAILEQVARHPHERVVRLDLAGLPPIDQAARGAQALITSPDIMVLARDAEALRAGDLQIVMAECHDTFMIWGWSLYFHPQRQAVEAAARRLLARAAAGDQIANILASKRVKIVPFEYPGPTIEMLATSEKPDDQRIPITEVVAAVEDDRPVLRAPGRPGLTLYNGELPTLAHSMFALPRVVAPPLTAGDHTPRLMLGDLILQREQWRVARQDLLPRQYQGASFDLMYDFWRAARRLKLPRYLFGRTPGERKPVLIDRHNYFLLELLDYLLPADTQIHLSEMLPAPDQLWLRGEPGAFCAELRLSACYVLGEERADA